MGFARFPDQSAAELQISETGESIENRRQCRRVGNLVRLLLQIEHPAIHPLTLTQLRQQQHQFPFDPHLHQNIFLQSLLHGRDQLCSGDIHQGIRTRLTAVKETRLIQKTLEQSFRPRVAKGNERTVLPPVAHLVLFTINPIQFPIDGKIQINRSNDCPISCGRSSGRALLAAGFESRNMNHYGTKQPDADDSREIRRFRKGLFLHVPITRMNRGEVKHSPRRAHSRQGPVTGRSSDDRCNSR